MIKFYDYSRIRRLKDTILSQPLAKGVFRIVLHLEVTFIVATNAKMEFNLKVLRES